MAFWLLMQSVSVAHSYSHELQHGDRTGASGSFGQQIVLEAHDHASHEHHYQASCLKRDAGLPGQDGKPDCCDDTLCKAGELLPVHSAGNVQEPSRIANLRKSSAVSWSPGSFTPPPNTTV